MNGTPAATPTPSSPTRLSQAALWGLILGVVGFCFAPIGIVGLILGIVGVMKISRSPALRGKGIAIAAIACGGLAVPVNGIALAVSMPAFTHYVRRAKMAEAEDKLAYLFRSTVQYATQERSVRGQGPAVETPRLPPSAPLTPSEPPHGVRAIDPPAIWDQPTWRALDFALSDPHYYAYEFRASEDGRSFVIRAIGDLNGDGVCSTFERSGRIDANGDVIGTPMRSIRPTE